MRYKFFIYLVISFIISHLWTATGFAQDSWVFDSETTITVNGGSTLSDWSASTSTISGMPEKLTLQLQENGQIEGFSFRVDSRSLDGGRGAAMNEKIHAALKVDQYPEIVYQQSGGGQLSRASDGNWLIKTEGILSIAGVDQAVEVDVQASADGDNLSLVAEKDLAMSVFEIEPPSAMFGQIQTEDSITVSINFSYRKQ